MNMTSSLTNGKTSEIDSDHLHEALRALWDLMEFYQWLVTHETAKGIKENNLQVDKITGAIPKRYLTEEVRSAIKTQLDYWQDRGISEPYVFNEDWIKWTYKGIPIELQIVKRRYNFFENPDSVTYNFDDFKLPNPFLKYWKAQYILK